MNKKWYRSNFVKVLLIVVFHGTLAIAAACGVFLLAMASKGIHIWGDKGNTYMESVGFADTLYNSAYKILSGLNAEGMITTEETGTDTRVVDLEEIYEGENLTYENHSGLAYSVKNLQKWAESSWGAPDEYCNVVMLIPEAGEPYYYYYKDFSRMVEEGKITFAFEETYGVSEKEAAAEILESLKYGMASEYSEEVRSVKDEERNVEYADIRSFDGGELEEKYAPEGADDLLDAVNENPEWKGRLEDAYNALDDALNTISLNQRSADELKEYGEGNTNLAYLYVDLDQKKVYTNRESYSQYGEYEAALKEMTGQDAYIVVTPKLSDCETNLNLSETNSLSVWQHAVEQAGIAENFIYALAVDGTFPVADSLAETNMVYQQYAERRVPVSQALVFAVLLFLASLVWLTVIAGKRPEDEEVHLNIFDRIFTEIAAVGVFNMWVLCLDGFVTIYGGSVNSTSFLATGVAAGIFTGAMFLLGYLSLIRRIKAGTLWKNSFLRWSLRAVRRILGKTGEAAELLSRNAPEKIKLALLAGGFLVLQLLSAGDAVFLLVLVAADFIALLYLLRKADGKDRILEGLKRISGGELQYKIPVDKLTGNQKTMAEYINHIGEGLDAAVENSLKNERMKTELITNVSHDIKTPLTSIINYVDLLKRENFTDPKICGYLDVLEAKAQRLKTLTEDVVEASKASAGTIALEMTELNFSEMLHQVMGEFEEKFEERNLTLMVHLAEEPVVIRADGQRLWRVLENVFNNVVKYALEGTRVYVQTTPEKGRVVFSLKNISSQPLNISADELTERFIRGDVSRNTEGSGLGLSIAKSLTELQGGEFRLYLDGDLFKVIITFPLVVPSEK